MLQEMISLPVIKCVTLGSVERKKTKFPNNLLALMERDGVTTAMLCKAWGVERGDVSQRIHGKVSLTQQRRDILFQQFGWTASDLFEPLTSDEERELLEIFRKMTAEKKESFKQVGQTFAQKATPKKTGMATSSSDSSLENHQQ